MERHLLAPAFAASLLCLGFSVARAGINEWTTKGPPGGNYVDLEASTTDGNVFYAAYGHSFFRSTDGGATWTERPFDRQVNDIAVDPADGNRLLVAVLDSGLFRSLDGGQTFTKIAPDTSIWATAIGPNNVMYYSTPVTFHRSTNGGDSFGPPSGVLQSISQIVVSPTDANSVVAKRGPFFMRSTDGGANWSEAPITNSNDFIMSLERLPSGTVVAALESGIYTSTDNGTNWTSRLPGFSYSISLDRSAADTLIATRLGTNALRRSTDGGITWPEFGAAPQGNIRRAVVSRTSSSRLIVANENGVQRSTDSAATWADATSGPVASGLLSMATTVAATSRVYAFTTGIRLYSASNDSTWERLDAANVLPFAQGTLAVRPGVPLSLFVGSFGSGVYRSVDGGRTFAPPGNGDLSGLSIDSLGFDPVDSSIMYASVASGGNTPAASFVRSTNGGVSWSARSVDLPEVHGFRMAVDPANGQRIFLAGYQGFFPAGVGGLWFSNNAGVNWNRIGFAGQDVNDVAIDPSDSNRVYAATATGLQVSTDGGVIFVRNDPHSLVTTQPPLRIAIDPAVPSTIYSVTNAIFAMPQPASFVLRSVDRGQTWETLRKSSDAPNFFIGQVMLDPNVPSLIYVDTGVRGVAAYEIVNDLAITIGGHSGLRPTGSPSTFQLRGEHLGALAATDVRLVATLPAGLTNVSATTDRGTCAVAGVTLTCTVPVLRPTQVVNAVVTYTPPSAMVLNVQAAIAAHERDTTAANSSATATAITGEVADLRVTVAPSAGSITRGANVTYTVQVTNGGPIDSSSSVLTFTPGSGLTPAAAPSGCTGSGTMTCNLSALANGATQSFQFAATAQTAGSVTASAAIVGAAAAADPVAANNTASVSITVTELQSGGNGGGGGGGGSMEWLTLLALSIFLRKPRRQAR